jgi:hypothetical protein
MFSLLSKVSTEAITYYELDGVRLNEGDTITIQLSSGVAASGTIKLEISGLEERPILFATIPEPNIYPLEGVLCSW